MKHFYVEQSLSVGQSLTLPESLQHRLAKVLRMGAGSRVGLFDGENGLFEAELTDAKARTARILGLVSRQKELPRLELVLALPKREAWETALRQATELGVTAIWPVKSDFAQVGKLNPERAQMQVVEAAEQCERLNLPVLHPLQPLSVFLQELNEPCAWAYERGVKGDEKGTTPKTCKVLVGPEGGFSPAEVAALQANPHIRPFTLGQTVLRTDTAVVAALALLVSHRH